MRIIPNWSWKGIVLDPKIELHLSDHNTLTKHNFLSSYDLKSIHSYELALFSEKDTPSSQENAHKEQDIIKNLNPISDLNVLIVEDNKMSQLFIKQLFTIWNIKPDTADNGKIAVDKVKQNSYDLILMDMHMPIMDGIEATKIIRNSNNNKIDKIPIAGCSADIMPESKKKAFDSGMDFYITKPVNEASLEKILFNIKNRK